MKTIRNIVIGTLIATLLFSMLATPAAAIVTANPFVDPDFGSGDVVRDNTGTPLCGDGDEVDDDILQVIRDKSKDGISPPGPDGVPTDPDDEWIYNPSTGSGELLYIGKGGYTGCLGKFMDTVYPELLIGDRIYLRAWNAPSIDAATHYGDSPVYHDMVDGTNYYDYCPTGHTWGTLTPKPAVSKDVPMKAGWNAVSLCYEPSDNSTSSVLSSIAGNYSAVKEWDASSDIWVDATTMDRGKGYFVHVTSACTWNHTGQNKTDPMTIPLEQGLNLVGYPFNKVNSTSDALAGLDYYYAAPFDANTQKYEDTYNPVAPSVFNDFTTLSPCEGFWVSSKDGGDWTAS